MQAALDSTVCHTPHPLNNLSFSWKGSALTFRVAYQVLGTGLLEVGWGSAERGGRWVVVQNVGIGDILAAGEEIK